jgi:hypothetical protein
MMESMALLSKSMDCLTENLGLAEAERFIASINVEPFDYARWRRDNLFKNMSVEELSHAAMEFRQTKKGVPLLRQD